MSAQPRAAMAIEELGPGWRVVMTWLIRDEDCTLGFLRSAATPQLLDSLAERGLKPTGPATWRVRGLLLEAEVPVDPYAVLGGGAAVPHFMKQIANTQTGPISGKHASRSPGMAR